VVSGEHVDRDRQPGEQLAHALVLARAGVGDEISGDQDRIRPGAEAEDRIDRRRERPRRLSVAAPDADVGIAELREDGQIFFTWS
jgi:hypothetical protein